MINNKLCQTSPKLAIKTIIRANPSANGKVLKFKDIYIGYK